MRDSVDRHVETWTRELPWMDPVQEAIAARLAILGRHLARSRRDALDAGGLRHWEFKVLLTLRRLGPPYSTSPSHLADLLGLTRGALSNRLRPLEDAGLLTRATDPADRRRVHVRLTPAGSAAFDRHTTTESNRESALLSALTPAQRTHLADLLRTLVHSAESDTQSSSR
ncbi:MarR family winged helix-turn-helix transcriptional regulator [Catenuloplanes sp. NPDC051500]|uniref:MarR family winged helix-turn-helix transcriptional regulator n=1 Tax=Catenuloplanes sp. NPDC051500 TaxID=3363959 RepID=UPI0037A92B17